MTISTRTRYIVLAIIGIGVVAGIALSGRGDEPPYEFIVAERRDLVQEVAVTGRVQASENLELSFQVGGKVAWIGADVGEQVAARKALVGLVSSDIEAQLGQARALVTLEEAKLDELNAGTRAEEIRVQEVRVTSATKTKEDAQIAVVNALSEAYTDADDAIRNKVDQFITNPRSNDPQLSFTLSDPQQTIAIESGRVNAESILLTWQGSLAGISVQSDLDSFIATAQSNLMTVKDYLRDVAFAVNGLKESSSLSQAVIDGYRADIGTARMNIDTAIATVATVSEDLRSADSSLELAEEELSLKQAGTRAEQIVAQEAKLTEARAQVAKLEADLAKTVIRAPIAGVVSRQDAEVGEIVAANDPIVRLISDTDFEIEMFVPEADIAKLEFDDIAEVTLDAYGSATFFEAQVVSIDPAETVVEGVSTYKTILRFTEGDARIRSGMTANVTIMTDKREGVISVPGRAVIFDNGDRFVRIAHPDNTIEKRVVTVGLRGSDGSLEIVEGVAPGEKVIVFLPDER